MARGLRAFTGVVVPAEPVYFFPYTRPKVGSGQEFKGFSSFGVFSGRGFMMFLNQAEFQGHKVRDIDPFLIT